MPEFTVNCTSRESGKDYTIRVKAATIEEAYDTAGAEGHMTTTLPVKRPASTPSDVSADAVKLHADLLELRLLIEGFGKAKSTTGVWTVFGILLLLLGAAGLLYSFVMPITVGALDPVVNMAMIHDRALTATACGAAFIAGAVFLAASAIAAQLRAIPAAAGK
jgi:hypothetical protein